MLPYDKNSSETCQGRPDGREPARILVVEDDFLVRMVAEAAGFSVLSAASADEALGLLEDREDVAAVFSDVEMPGSLNGLALARIVQARWPWIGIVITSGRTFVAERDLPRGARFLAKPYRSSRLLELLRGVGADTVAAGSH